MRTSVLGALVCAIFTLPSGALSTSKAIDQGGKEDGFVPLFNGKDLTGWVNVNCAPETFTVKDDMIACTGFPTGLLRTEKQYENFILEMEWMHLKPKGNGGLFVWSDPLTYPGQPFARAIEVQIMDGVETATYTSHGDIFSIWGAKMTPDRPHPTGQERCLPSEKRSKPAGEWNHYRVECNDGVIKLAVNGKVVSGGYKCSPRKGYLCLESEGSPVHYKNLRIKELASTNPKPNEIANVATGFRPLYFGLDLRNWKGDEKNKGHWRPQNSILTYDGKGTDLWSEKSYGDFELICDWRLTTKPQKVKHPVILPSGQVEKDADGKTKEVEVLDAGASGIHLRGDPKCEVNIWCWPVGSGEVHGYRTDPKMPPEVRAGATPKRRADKGPPQWNRFHITMTGDRLTVLLNGILVIDNVQLPGVAPRGPIGLQHQDAPIQFANIFIRELN